MSIPRTLEDNIQDGLSKTISHRNFNGSATIHYKDNDDRIHIPMNSIISKYKDYFDRYTIEIELTEDEQRDYRYSPKKFSNDMYGTEEYWSIILYINECHSIFEFEPITIKYILPEILVTFLNEIMILEDLDV